MTMSSGGAGKRVMIVGKLLQPRSCRCGTRVTSRCPGRKCATTQVAMGTAAGPKHSTCLLGDMMS
jgi:hypothetical protein